MKLFSVKNIKKALKAGIDPNIRKGSDENTPLHYQYDGGIVKQLLRFGANPNARNYDKDTPLHWAKDPEAVRVLLEAGANPNAEGKYNQVPLVNEYDCKVIRTLLENGADPYLVCKIKKPGYFSQIVGDFAKYYSITACIIYSSTYLHDDLFRYVILN